MNRRAHAWVASVAALALAPLAVHAADEPATAPAPTVGAGDTWIFDHVVERTPSYFHQERTNISVERVDSDSMLLAVKEDGSPRAPLEQKVGLDWVQKRILDHGEVVTGKAFSFPMSVGKTWTVEYTDPSQRGQQSNTHIKRTYKVVGWEDVTVPAGTFHALKIESSGVLDAHVVIAATAVAAATATASGGTTMAHTQKAQAGEVHETVDGFTYYAPSVKYFVKTVDEHYNANNVRVSRETEELASFKPGQK